MKRKQLAEASLPDAFVSHARLCIMQFPPNPSTPILLPPTRNTLSINTALMSLLSQALGTCIVSSANREIPTQAWQMRVEWERGEAHRGLQGLSVRLFLALDLSDEFSCSQIMGGCVVTAAGGVEEGEAETWLAATLPALLRGTISDKNHYTEWSLIYIRSFFLPNGNTLKI